MKEKQALFTLYLTNFTKVYYAVFYDNSVILAYIDKPIKKELSKALKRTIKEKKISLMQRGKFTKDYWENIGSKYLYMNKEETVCECNNNFEIRYCNIENVKVSPYKTESTKAHEDPPIIGQIWFYGYSEKHHFNHKYKKENEKITMLREQFLDKFTLLK